MELCQELKKFQIESLSDAMDTLGLKGVLYQMNGISKNRHAVGIAYTVEFCKDYEKEKCVAADYIDEVKENQIIVIQNNGEINCSVWGNILTHMAVMKQIQGTIINGACRDVACIKEKQYPLFAKGTTCKTGKGIVKLKSVGEKLQIDGVTIQPGDYIVAQESSVLVIPKEKVGQVIQTALEIEQMEDKILKAITKDKIPLKEAREKYHYNRYK